MKVSIWHHTADCQPVRSGYYLCYRGWGMAGKGDYDSDNGYCYYSLLDNQWFEYDDCNNGAIIYYWTDADPQKWTDEDPPVTKRKRALERMPAAEKIAYDQMMAAIDHYKVVKALTNGID